MDVLGRSCASLRPRHTVHPEHKRVLELTARPSAPAIQTREDDIKKMTTVKNLAGQKYVRFINTHYVKINLT
jgi:hypothetical protein